MNPIPSPEEIRRGETTDVYFVRTMEVLRKLGKEKVRVKAECFVKRFPDAYEYAVLSGRDEMLSLLAGRSLDVLAMDEGSLFLLEEPVFSVEGPYGEFCEMETAMLGILCQASGIATKTSRIRWLAGDRTVLSFGARRMHPALSTLIDRHAFLGGADGVSVVRSAEYLGEAAQGTMPHALILVLGDTVEALRGFDDAVAADIPRVCLVDTLQDEKFEALRAAEALGKSLAAVRLDTPSSRRGDFRKILREVRWSSTCGGSPTCGSSSPAAWTRRRSAPCGTSWTGSAWGRASATLPRSISPWISWRWKGGRSRRGEKRPAASRWSGASRAGGGRSSRKRTPAARAAAELPRSPSFSPR